MNGVVWLEDGISAVLWLYRSFWNARLDIHIQYCSPSLRDSKDHAVVSYIWGIQLLRSDKMTKIWTNPSPCLHMSDFGNPPGNVQNFTLNLNAYLNIYSLKSFFLLKGNSAIQFLLKWWPEKIKGFRKKCRFSLHHMWRLFLAMNILATNILLELQR